ncbi:MAG: phosphoglycerate kinase [Candidatus Saccharibacteria bacterium]|nr:phosphoglycerate kinase [Candidatus Saccharibacteria bacterium]
MSNFRKKTIQDVEIAGKTVLVRVDYNVPIKDGVIQEDMRICGSLSTIRYLLDQGARKVILMSHLGRPDGAYVPEMSLAPCAQRLGELLPDKVVRFSDMIYGQDAKDAVAALPEGGILLLENLRYVPDEEENSAEFAQEIVDATGAELFVQDGFAVIHRAHASTDAIARILPAVAGFLVENEVSRLEGAMENPERPLLVIVGGAKVADKQPLIDKFLPIADKIAVGGKIAADGYTSDDPKIYVAEDFAEDENGAKLDIGPASTAKIVDLINESKTIVWNGTLGMVENEVFARGSYAIAKAMGEKHDSMTIIGGGDTAGYVESVIKNSGELSYSLISTGGGASLELLSGKKLPGLEVLQDK